jgi:succinate dehydrogenase/fumarate reductase flavoprotein subunit
MSEKERNREATDVATAGKAGKPLTQNSKAVAIADIPEEHIETDVLIIGGGIAGTWAALRAKQKGVKVTLVDKGMVGRSGKSPWFGVTCFYDPDGGTDGQEWVDASLQGTEFIGHKDYFKYFLKDSKNCWDEMVTWGVNKPNKSGHAGLFREQLLKAGVELRERIMITDLIKQNGEIVGAAGFPVDEDKLIVFKTKAVLNCGGAGTFKGPGYAVGPITFDAHMMAYRAGAEISGKEWTDFHTFPVKDPTMMWGMDFGHGLWAATKPEGHPQPIAAISAHQVNVPYARPGRPPGPPPGTADEAGNMRPPMPPGPRPDIDESSFTMSGTSGMAEHHLDGIFPKDDKFSSTVPGLFAAGDALCTAGSGMLGSGSAVSSSHAANAGEIVADYVMKRSQPAVDAAEISKAKERIFKSRSTAKGYSPAWVTQLMQSMMIPYHVLNVKKENRLQAALTNIEFLREQYCENLLANDAHELRLAHEIDNMALNAEMKLRASLLRTESRHNHYREDYPARDDENWLAWVIIEKQGEEMKVSKRLMPEEWRPDLSVPYKERYVLRFPGEIEFLESKKI